MNILPIYFVDEGGTVYKKNGTTLDTVPQHSDKDGYKRVNLKTDDGRRTIAVHRLVAAAYIENPLGLPVVNHINGIKDDNRAVNLEWSTISWNTKHGYMLRNYHFTKPVNVLCNGEVVRTFQSIKDCAEYYGVTYFDISKIANGKIKHRKKGALAGLDFKFVD